MDRWASAVLSVLCFLGMPIGLFARRTAASHVPIALFFGQIPLSVDGIWGSPAETIPFDNDRSRRGRRWPALARVGATRPAVPTPPSRAYLQDYGRSRQLPQNITCGLNTINTVQSSY